MESIAEHYKKSGLLHHTYLIEGNSKKIVPRITGLIEDVTGRAVTGDPDVHFDNYDKLGVDDAEEIRKKASSKNVGEHKFFVLTVNRYTEDASHALLKTLEDTPEKTHFFLIVPTLDTVLPTIRSRSYVVVADTSFEESADTGDFISGTIGQRLEIVDALLERIEEDGAHFRQFLAELENDLAKKRNLAALEELRFVKKASKTNAANYKLLLRHLALTIPLDASSTD